MTAILLSTVRCVDCLRREGDMQGTQGAGAPVPEANFSPTRAESSLVVGSPNTMRKNVLIGIHVLSQLFRGPEVAQLKRLLLLLWLRRQRPLV